MAATCIYNKTFFMKKILLTAIIVSVTSICYAQQKHSDTTTVKFTPPVIVKDTEVKEVVKFSPPVIKKNRTTKARKPKRTEAVKFTPPVITKDSAKE